MLLKGREADPGQPRRRVPLQVIAASRSVSGTAENMTPVSGGICE